MSALPLITIDGEAKLVNIGLEPDNAEVHAIMRRLGYDAPEVIRDAAEIAGRLRLRWGVLQREGHVTLRFAFKLAAPDFKREFHTKPIAQAFFDVVYKDRVREMALLALVREEVKSGVGERGERYFDGFPLPEPG